MATALTQNRLARMVWPSTSQPLTSMRPLRRQCVSAFSYTRLYSEQTSPDTKAGQTKPKDGSHIGEKQQAGSKAPTYVHRGSAINFAIGDKYRIREPHEGPPLSAENWEDHPNARLVNWGFIIIDEGHRMKNFDSMLSRELRTFTSATRLLITGTPLQNNLRELWSLLHFLLPTIFSNWDAFESWFDFSDLQDVRGTSEFIADRENQDLIKKIHLVLQPLLLRRVKADVAKHLPKKREYILYAPMTKEQTDLYNAISDKNIDSRTFLENKVLETLEASRHGPAPAIISSHRTSKAGSKTKKVVPKKEDESLKVSLEC
ncbi:hypothetical protein BN1723_005450 [Verticillium longisporum]|uniref:Helicase ATP-binding domain-containing protein n=1 Tax=Verticillium longisporum TaxID=100787 RepID=A0A0G4N8F2_VERLO|nr:hypothetical protein BN1723_005450 [Verticillium longisporum]